MGYITLYAIVCLNLAQDGTCVREMVTDSAQNTMTIAGCLGVEGQVSAQKFVDQHPLYRTWHLKGWACQIGNRRPPENGRA
jgi:hypothetical protein